VPAALVQLQTTIDGPKRARELVRAVVEARLAACGQILGPMESTYWWKDSIDTSVEWLCVFKTRGDLVERLREFLVENHPYDVPEIVVLEIAGTSDDYGRWIEDEASG